MDPVTIGLISMGVGAGVKALRSNQLRRQQGQAAFSAQKNAMLNLVPVTDPETGDTVMVPPEFLQLATAEENKQAMLDAQAERSAQLAGIGEGYRTMAQQGLPDAVENLMSQNIQQGSAQLLRGLQASRGGLRGLSGIANQQNQAYQNLAMMDAQARQQAQRDYLQFQDYAAQQNYAMEADQLALNQQVGDIRYQMMYGDPMQRAMALRASAEENQNQMINTIGDTAGSIGYSIATGGINIDGKSVPREDSGLTPMTPKGLPSTYNPNASISNFIAVNPYSAPPKMNPIGFTNYDPNASVNNFISR